MTRFRGGRIERGEDRLVVEEPIEFQIRGDPIAAVMRTPGNDFDLAAGFFFAEGLIEGSGHIGALCRTAGAVDLTPSGEPPAPVASPRRRFGPVLSSCGVCGKSSVEDILRLVPPLEDGTRRASSVSGMSREVVSRLAERLRECQPLFEETGAIHAAGVFDVNGETLCVMEDIGRHNAVDKAIGRLLRQDRLPLDRHILVVSGRASFEIIQKALRGRVPVVVSVSGVSDLARELAERGGVSLCGFARGANFTVYTHASRFVDRPGQMQ